MPLTHPGYLIGNFTVTDPALLAEYSRQAQPLVEQYGGSMMLSDKSFSPVEGRAEAVFVIIAFPTLERATSFYNSPEYAPVKELRIQATEGGFLALTAVPVALA
ncbi:hypothetical protein GCM10007301_33570 [Azorhizobium oxalatiphilum]|uniref:DUF1330 domain-containing protein n=1 Tax=Azorhizobium oxalatiphilum TaxID=980631 RepID=A0A917C3V8_9HYPH|nr:DUF1330 domain-containing protein [Azorhizobium oxalatiphilum]GGF71117.1 hypothetical protein GCM10007301_33570 [Azorhizobium oxalatiphilum]